MIPIDSSVVREKILKHAIELFAQAGYTGTSVREIAAAAHVKKPALYYYFQEKRELYIEAVRHCSCAFATKLRESEIACLGPAERLKAIIECIIGFHREHNSFCRILGEALRAGEPQSRRIAVESLRLALGAVERCLRDGIEKGKFRPLAPTLMALTIVGCVASQIAWAGMAGRGKAKAVPFADSALERLPGYLVTLFSKGGRA